MPARPNDIPKGPDRVYRDKGWTNWGDWLGTGEIAPQLREYLSFQQARAFVHALNLKSTTEWAAYCAGDLHNLTKKPGDLPAAPNHKYKGKGWLSWPDFLGTAPGKKPRKRKKDKK